MIETEITAAGPLQGLMYDVHHLYDVGDERFRLPPSCAVRVERTGKSVVPTWECLLIIPWWLPQLRVSSDISY